MPVVGPCRAEHTEDEDEMNHDASRSGVCIFAVIVGGWLATGCVTATEESDDTGSTQIARTKEPEEPPDPDGATAAACFAATTVGTFSVSPGPGQLSYGQAYRLVWDVSAGCSGLTTNFGSLAGTRDYPGRNDGFAYVLTGTVLGYSTTLAQVIVSHLALPCASGASLCTVHVAGDNQQQLLIDAVGRNNTHVEVSPGVNMDLSDRGDIRLASNVVLSGGGGAFSLPGGGTRFVPGALLYTTTYPNNLLLVQGADNVRITGLRLRGASQEPNDNGPRSFGITVYQGFNVEIDHDEIFGWNNAAVRINDEPGALSSSGRITRQNGVGAVRVRHNLIHHNQLTSEGYGVVVSNGAYALVEKNAFDFNRHSMAGDSEPATSGYFFYRNLVLEHGGIHTLAGTLTTHTHVIDMHGTATCEFTPAYCGLAGEYMEIAGNTVLYTNGTAIKIRGVPTDRVDVSGNVFAHSAVWAGTIGDAALETTVPAALNVIFEWGNTFGLNPMPRQYFSLNGLTIEGPRLRTPDVMRFCDFDGDGVDEEFYATGTSWWVKKVGDPDYAMRYLNTSTLRLSELATGDVNGDGICDVKSLVDGRVFFGGTQSVRHEVRADLLWQDSASNTLRSWLLSGGAISGVVTVPFPVNRTVLGIGDFDGDGDDDVLSTFTPGGGTLLPTVVTFLQDGAVVGDGPALYIEPGTQLAAIADFDGDGKADVLWRTASGRLDLWQKEGSAVAAHPSPHNDGVPMGPEWQVAGTRDFNGDGYADLVWRNTNGQVVVWLLVGSVVTGELAVGTFLPSMALAGIGDFDADGFSDILWRDTATGALTLWFKGASNGAANVTPPDRSWTLKAVSDFDGDGRSDLLWNDITGHGILWFMRGAQLLRSTSLPAMSGSQLLGVLAKRSER